MSRPTPGNRVRALSTGTDRMEELQNLFQMFDIDGNGTIDCDEIAALLKKLGFTKCAASAAVALLLPHNVLFLQR